MKRVCIAERYHLNRKRMKEKFSMCPGLYLFQVEKLMPIASEDDLMAQLCVASISERVHARAKLRIRLCTAVKHN